MCDFLLDEGGVQCVGFIGKYEKGSRWLDFAR
jgi:hypothetical protein